MDAAPGAYDQNRACRKGVGAVVTELDDVRTDGAEGVEGREIGVGKSGKRQESGCLSGAVRAKPTGWCVQSG